jgi:hypothetical protein
VLYYYYVFQYAIASEAVVDPCQHPCLSVLPAIFHQAMSGVAAMVDSFLGMFVEFNLGF